MFCSKILSPKKSSHLLGLIFCVPLFVCAFSPCPSSLVWTVCPSPAASCPSPSSSGNLPEPGPASAFACWAPLQRWCSWKELGREVKDNQTEIKRTHLQCFKCLCIRCDLKKKKKIWSHTELEGYSFHFQSCGHHLLAPPLLLPCV